MITINFQFDAVEDGAFLFRKFRQALRDTKYFAPNTTPEESCIDIQRGGDDYVIMTIGKKSSNPEDDVTFTLAALPAGSIDEIREDNTPNEDPAQLTLPLEEPTEDEGPKPSLTQIDKSEVKAKPVVSDNPLTENLDEFIESKKPMYDAIRDLLSKSGKEYGDPEETAKNVMGYIHTVKCVIASAPTSGEDKDNFMKEATNIYKDIKPAIDKVFKTMNVSKEITDVHICVVNGTEYVPVKPETKTEDPIEIVEPEVISTDDTEDTVYNMDTGEITKNQTTE